MLRRRVEKLEACSHRERGRAAAEIGEGVIRQALGELTDGELERLEQAQQINLSLERNMQVQATLRKYARRVTELSFAQPEGLSH